MGGMNGVKMVDCAREALMIAEEGLRQRGRTSANGLIPDEGHFLDVLNEILDTGMTPAEELLNLYRSDWNRSLDPVFDECCY